MGIVIRNGKPQASEWLYKSCYWAHIQRGFAESEEVILCAFLRQPHAVPFKVSYCTDYSDKRGPSRRDMEEIACHSHQGRESPGRIRERCRTRTRTRGGRT